MPTPTLYVFAISHYCEKARWALDHCGIAYTLKHLAPGRHMEVAKQHGAPGSSVPWLVAGDALVHGSGAILDWAEATAPDATRSLRPDAAHEAECRAIEQRCDDQVGVHARRSYYSEAIVEHPDSVRPMFTRDLEPEERKSIEANWGVVAQMMTARMDLGREQGEESRRIVAGELDWFDGLLADGRSYLVGDRFTRADITAASLLAALVHPKEHPTYGNLQVPPRTAATLAGWADRPTFAWVRDVYRKHRHR